MTRDDKLELAVTALAAIRDKLGSYLLDHTDEGMGFEAIPEVDEARTLAMDAINELTAP